MKRKGTTKHSVKERNSLCPKYVPKKNLYELQEENLKLAERTVFLTRLIYCGEHKFSAEQKGDGINVFYEKIIKTINHSREDKATGFLLHYPNYFCVVIDAPQTAIHDHYGLLFNSREMKTLFGRIKLLAAYHNMNKRFLNLWTNLSTKPPELSHSFSLDDSRKESMNAVMRIIGKLYNLGITLDVMNNALDETHSKLSLVTDTRIVNCLPENSYLEYLLQSDHLFDLYDFFMLENSTPWLKPVDSRYTWPLGSSFVPTNLLQPDIKCIEDFPKQVLQEMNLQN